MYDEQLYKLERHTVDVHSINLHKAHTIITGKKKKRSQAFMNSNVKKFKNF